MSDILSDYCAVVALAAGEPLIGTAQRNACHFVLSIPKKEWLKSTAEMDGLAGAFHQVIEPLKDQAILSLKHGSEAERGTVWLFPHGYRFDGLTAADYPELVESALNAQLSFKPSAQVEGQVLLICTHGKRDVSCAKFGGEVLEALKKQALPPDLALWETSHIGGHRLAGTLILQPQQQWYGFLTPEEVPHLLAHIQAKRVLTSHYRGNAHYPPPLQVAEFWGWEQLGDQTGEIHLLNPQINGQTAQVQVGVYNGVDPMQITTLHLQAKDYTFFPDSHSDKTNTRFIWYLEPA